VPHDPGEEDRVTTTPCPPRAATITIVEARGCHFCADAHAALNALVEQGHELQVGVVDARSPEGVALMQRHRAGLSPLVLVDGAFFSQGRLPRHKLARLLEQRSSTSTPASEPV
jgi:hypothetical protein